MKITDLAMVSLLASTLCVPAASATDINHITISGLACSPLPASEPMLARTLTGWRFASGQVGTVEFLCPLPMVLPAAHVVDFELVYTDTDGVGAASQVLATLRRVRDFDTYATVHATINSNGSISTGPTVRWVNAPSNYDLYGSSYYVRVLMKRTVVTQNPEFRAARLTYKIL